MSIFHLALWEILVVLISFLTGYVFGKRIGGRRAGVRASAATALHLRQQALQTGVCPTCDGISRKVLNYVKKE